MILNRKPADVFKDVGAFTELAQPNMLPQNGIISQKAIELAIKLIEEECNQEYIPALQTFALSITRENLIKVIDGAMDVIYVASWAMKVFGVDGTPFWNEVQRSNMAKFPYFDPQALDEQTGTTPLPVPLDLPEYKRVNVEYNKRKDHWVITNADTGKVMKPRGWTPPDLFKVAEELEMIHKLRTMPDSVATNFYPSYFKHMEVRIEKGEIVG